MKRLALALLFVPNIAAAHDHWLIAEPFFVAPQNTTIVHHHLGSGFKSEEERAWEPPLTTRFELHTEKAVVNLLERMPQPGKKPPIVALKLEDPGTHLLVLDRKLASIVLPAPELDHYLVEEALEHIRAERKKRGEQDRFGREKYTRHLKALIQSGDKTNELPQKIIGQTLELVPLANPYAKGKGSRLPVKLLFEGKPLAGTRITAFLEGGHHEHVTTAEDGTAELSLHKGGTWMIRALHMRRCQKNCEEHDWESFWASLTFAIR